MEVGMKATTLAEHLDQYLFVNQMCSVVPVTKHDILEHLRDKCLSITHKPTIDLCGTEFMAGEVFKAIKEVI